MRYRQAKKIVWGVRPTHSIKQLEDAFNKVMRHQGYCGYLPYLRDKFVSFIKAARQYKEQSK